MKRDEGASGLWPHVGQQSSCWPSTSVSHMPGDGVDAWGWGTAPPLVWGSQELGIPACLGQTSSRDSSQAPVGSISEAAQGLSAAPPPSPDPPPPLCSVQREERVVVHDRNQGFPTGF